MGQASNRVSSNWDVLDTVITNALIVDAVTGIIKADVGIKDGKIAGIGKAGNPDCMEGVTPVSSIDILKIYTLGLGNLYKCHYFLRGCQTPSLK